MAESLSSKDDAQARADQIAAFRAELRQLQREGVRGVSDADLAAVHRYHDTLLDRLAGDFDIDRTVAERRMSLGMRVASAFGAATLTAAVVSFVYQVWGLIPTTGQVALLTAGPLAALAAMLVAGHLERTRYVAAIMAVVACGAFVLQTLLIGQIFNLRTSPHLLLVWGLFAIAVAVPWRFVLPFALGVFAVTCYAGALALWVNGMSWSEFVERPEPVMAAAALLLPLTPRLPDELVTAGRTVLLVQLLGPLLLLSAVAEVSLLPWTPSLVRITYQILAGAATVAIVVAGVRRSLDDVILIGALFGGVFLLTRFVDWWWDWMPRYLFFLMLAVVALAWIAALRRLRGHATLRGAA